MTAFDYFCCCLVVAIVSFVAGVEIAAALRPNRTVYLLVKDPPRTTFRIDCSAEGREACKVQARHERIVLKGKP